MTLSRDMNEVSHAYKVTEKGTYVVFAIVVGGPEYLDRNE